MSQQVMLRGEHKGRRILLWILALSLCITILDLLNPAMLHKVISGTLKAAIQLWDYLGDILDSLRQILSNLSGWFH